MLSHAIMKRTSVKPFSSIQVFDHDYLAGDTASGEVERSVSVAVPAGGNTAVISAILESSVSLSVTNKLVFLLEGTYDGKFWTSLYSSNKIEFTANAPKSSSSSTLTGISFAAVRLRATINGTSAKAIFSAWIAFSEQ